MPHIRIQMLRGRTPQQKADAAKAVAEALVRTVGCDPKHVSVAVEDYTPQEWQTVYAQEVAGNDHLFVEADYDPKDVLK